MAQTEDATIMLGERDRAAERNKAARAPYEQRYGNDPALVRLSCKDQKAAARVAVRRALGDGGWPGDMCSHTYVG